MNSLSVSDILDRNRLASEKVGTSRNGSVDFACRFQHVIQKAWMGKALLKGDTAWYYHNQIAGKAASYGVLPVCQVIMPNHVHELYFCEDVSSVSKLRAVACRNATVFMKKRQQENGYRVLEHLFEPRPGYVAVKDRRQLLRVLKYIKDNDLAFRAAGEKAPYSSFDLWEEKDIVKPFGIDAVCRILELSRKQLLEVLNREPDGFMKAFSVYDDPSEEERFRSLFRK